MTRLALVLALALASPALADGEGQAPEPQPQPESIERTTMGGSFPVESLVTMIVIGIVAAALNAD